MNDNLRMKRITESNYTNIENIITTSSNVLSELSTITNAVDAFRKKFPPMYNWVCAHIPLIIAAALYEGNRSKSERYFCINIICANLREFARKLSEDQEFLNRLNEYISNPTLITKTGLSSFSSIMQSVIERAQGNLLQQFPDKLKLIEKLFQYIDSPPIFSLLYFFTGAGNQFVVKFLDNELFIDQFFAYIGRFPNQILRLTTNLVHSIDPCSPCFKHLTRDCHLDIFMNIAISNNIFSSLQAFRLLFLMCAIVADLDIDDDEEEDNPLNVCEFIIGNIDRICAFITELPFTPSDVSASELLIGVIPAMDEIPDTIYNTAKFFFEMMFKYPHHSELHLCCYRLFGALVEKDSNVFDRVDIRPKIIEAYQIYKDNCQCVFWGHLHELTKFVTKLNPKTECPGWNEYLENVYRKKERLISQPYGGRAPKNMARDINFLNNIDIF